MKIFMPENVSKIFYTQVDKFIRNDDYLTIEAKKLALEKIRYSEDPDWVTNSDWKEAKDYLNRYVKLYNTVETKMESMAIKLGYEEGTEEFNEWVSEKTYERVKRQILLKLAREEKKKMLETIGIKVQGDVKSQKDAYLAT